ncbi:glucosamine-6-phosphate deaminase [Christiangramia crocea]|uniref:Glucosamine-6-phosphate deaminase n=1 Tax=Christiangramia crocea TaxID=2904124 RepID=A0A9X1UXG8_9FLAO|nr:glucosamine-6-phosphate deaminase [Gramella crocea]MCG9972147.1 glucosamine-6-phosphate deaminase [Gramella crocea]
MKDMKQMLDLMKDVNVFPTKKITGEAAGKAIEKCILKLQEKQGTIRIIFAAAPSQDTMLAYLSKSSEINWNRIVAFNMDEYLDLPTDAPQLFSKYLEEHLFSKVDIKEVYTINPNIPVHQEIERYSKLINQGPIDIVCLGIGENGHIAFNDPPVADFQDSKVIKTVELDDLCRKQQVNDDCFEDLSKVPKKAITLTVPTLMAGKNLFCIVIGENKADAVNRTLTGPISETCPASILRKHPQCKFYFDNAAFQNVSGSDD